MNFLYLILLAAGLTTHTIFAAKQSFDTTDAMFEEAYEEFIKTENMLDQTYLEAIEILMRTKIEQTLHDIIGNCCICLDTITPADIRITPCGHYFHKKCIGTFLARSLLDRNKPSNCPTCRTPLPLINEHLPLHGATLIDDLQQVMTLIGSGENLNRQDLRGTTALFYAAEMGHIVIMQILIDNGVNVNLSDYNDCTPLHIAIIKQKAKAVRILLNTPDIDINIKAYQGVSPLNAAAAIGNVEIIDMIAHAPGVNINSKSNDGMNPIHIAVRHTHIGAIKALIEAGADINARDNNNNTPLTMARRNGKIAIAQLLEQHGAQGEAAPVVHVIGAQCPMQ